MIQNKSPWIHQLDSEREARALKEDINVDIAVVGAGIAGVSSVFFLLKNTNKKIALLEKGRLAHGATGHNAGIVVSWFERPFQDIVAEFGLSLAGEAKRSVDSAWGLIDEIYTDAGLSIPFSRFMGHDAFSSHEDLIEHLETNRLFEAGGVSKMKMTISDDPNILSKIPEKYSGSYDVLPHSEILRALETKDPSYIAFTTYQFGTMNSALFCQEVIAYLLKKYADRFALYEHTNIGKVVLKHDYAILDAGNHTITANRVVLCTNGFEHFTIINETGLEINTRFHHNVSGVVGYMSGYFKKLNEQPGVFCYLPDKKMQGFSSAGKDTGVPYFYLSRRPYEYESAPDHNLISVGGHDVPIDDRHEYLASDEYPESYKNEIDSFVKRTLYTENEIDFQFNWHGLMGYTPNMIRLIGIEPKNPVLLYNLGCNGVGILPSIFGGKRIADVISQKTVSPSIFDPKDH